MLKKMVLISIPVVFLSSCASTPTPSSYQPIVKQPLPENDYTALAEGYAFFEKCLEEGYISTNDYGRARSVIDGKAKSWSYNYLVDYNKLDASTYAVKQTLDTLLSQSKKNSKDVREFKNGCLKLAGEFSVYYEQVNEANRQQQAILLNSIFNQPRVVQPAPSIRIDSPKTTICSGSSFGFGNFKNTSSLCNSF